VELILAIVAICQINMMAPNKDVLKNSVSYQKTCQVYLSKCIIQKLKADNEGAFFGRNYANQNDLLKCLAQSQLTKI